MRYYTYQPDADNYAGIGMPSANNQRLVDIHSIDKPLKPSWTSLVAHGFDDNPQAEGDFPSLSNYWRVPIISQRAWDTLQPLIGAYCEVLPIEHPSKQPFHVLHVMNTVDCLDEDRSVLRRSQIDGRVNHIFAYCFNNAVGNGRHIFKLPLRSGGELLVNDVFREAVEKNCLRGLLFRELPVIHLPSSSP